MRAMNGRRNGEGAVMGSPRQPRVCWDQSCETCMGQVVSLRIKSRFLRGYFLMDCRGGRVGMDPQYGVPLRSPPRPSFFADACPIWRRPAIISDSGIRFAHTLRRLGKLAKNKPVHFAWAGLPVKYPSLYSETATETFLCAPSHFTMPSARANSV